MEKAQELPFPTLSRGLFPYAVANDPVPDFATGVVEGNVCALTDDVLFEACGTRVAFVERTGGVSAAPYASLNLKKGIGDAKKAVFLNRAAAMSALGGGHLNVLEPNQVHGTRVLATLDPTPSGCSNAQEWMQRGCDAVVVGCNGLAAILVYADCLPLTLVAPGGVFAVVHCGWRGTVAHLASKAFGELVSLAECAPDQVNAYIGAYIHHECFGVDEDVAELFRAEFSEGVVFEDKGRCTIDLGAAVTEDLLGCGMDVRRVADADICTMCHTDRFFSFRGEQGNTGRHGAIAFTLDR